MITVTTLVLTCPACPTQWEGMTADGRHIYVRYRWGALRIGLGTTFEAAVRDHDTFETQLGDALDGRLTYEELIAATASTFQWPDGVSDWPQERIITELTDFS